MWENLKKFKKNLDIHCRNIYICAKFKAGGIRLRSGTRYDEKLTEWGNLIAVDTTLKILAPLVGIHSEIMTCSNLIISAQSEKPFDLITHLNRR